LRKAASPPGVLQIPDEQRHPERAFAARVEPYCPKGPRTSGKPQNSIEIPNPYKPTENSIWRRYLPLLALASEPWPTSWFSPFPSLSVWKNRLLRENFVSLCSRAAFVFRGSTFGAGPFKLKQKPDLFFRWPGASSSGAGNSLPSGSSPRDSLGGLCQEPPLG